MQASVELHDDKLCHTLLLHLEALGIERTTQHSNAELRFSDNLQATEGAICVLPLTSPLGYRYEAGRYLLNSNPHDLACGAGSLLSPASLGGWGGCVIVARAGAGQALAALSSAAGGG